MNRVIELLFKGRKPVDVSAVIHAKRVDPQRKKLTKELEKIDKSYKKIDVEVKKMKRSIDTSLAIAIATGGLR